METLRTDFIANVSHELKTPLAVIRNYGTMLQQPDLTEEKRLEYAKSVTEASRRLANLITNILKLNKLENQQIYPKAETYDLGEQLCACLLTFENAWESKALEIDTDVEEGVLVDADAELLSLVWNNLFSNAIKFTEPGGSLALSLHTTGDFAVVQVSDTGCGIPPEVGRLIFEKVLSGRHLPRRAGQRPGPRARQAGDRDRGRGHLRQQRGRQGKHLHGSDQEKAACSGLKRSAQAPVSGRRRRAVHVLHHDYGGRQSGARPVIRQPGDGRGAGRQSGRGAGLGAIARNRDADTVQRREQGRVFPPGHDRLDRRGRVRPRDGHGPLYGDPRHKANPKAAGEQRSVPR